MKILRSAARIAKIVAAALLLLEVAAEGTDNWRIVATEKPPPAEAMNAAVSIAGNVSSIEGTLDIAHCVSVDALKTSSGDFIHYSVGFRWLCTRHYAMKTDLPDGEAAGILELLELAWPHYCATFAARPPDGIRLALVAASSRDSLKRAMIDDSMFSFTLGGVTQEGYGCAFFYAGAPYQTRYIALHETTHLFQYCISGNTRSSYGFFLEGVADYISSHIFEPERRRLAVGVLDRAPIHNHLADGLAIWREAGEPLFSKLYSNPDPQRGIAVLMTAFLQSTPRRAAQWQTYCHEAALRRSVGTSGAKATSDALMQRLYGGSEALDASFSTWMRSLHPSYELASRDFDQEGARRFVSGYPASAKSPAVLVRKPSAGGEQADSVFIRWREIPERGAFAKVVINNEAGETVCSCVISNAVKGGIAYMDINGVRQSQFSGKMLHARLKTGVDLQLPHIQRTSSAVESQLGWTIIASQPGVEFAFGKAAEAAETTAQEFNDRKVPVFEPPTAKEMSMPLRWLVLGPFDGSSKRLRDSGRMLPTYPVDLNAVWTCDDGTFTAWRQAVHNLNAMFCKAPIANLTATFARQCDGASAFALATVESDGDRKALLSLGASDGVEIYVNGEKVHEDSRMREWQDCNIKTEITLKKGRNEILLRLLHGKGVWLLSGAITVE